MPRPVTAFRVLIASPGDVEEERTIARETVEEVNRQLSGAHAVTLEAIAWETHGVAGFGVDGQDVLNRTLPDFDILLGVMWTRLGTPTGRAPSGTVEEYERALERFRADNESVRIMFYFKTAAVPYDSDPLQFQAVKDFRQRVRTEGGLAYDFRSPSDFASLLRVQLPQVVTQWHRSLDPLDREAQSGGASAAVPRNESTDDAAEPDEPGIIDLIEDFSRHASELNGVASGMSVALDVLTQNINRHRTEWTEVASLGWSRDLGAARTVIRQTCRSMDEYTHTTERLLPELGGAIEDSIRSLGRIVPYLADFGTPPGEVQQVRTGLLGMRRGLEDMIGAMDALASSMIALPRMTVEFNRSKRRARGATERVAEAGRSGLALLDEAERTLDDLEGRER